MGNKHAKGGAAGSGSAVAAAHALPKGVVERHKGAFSEAELEALHSVFLQMGPNADFVTVSDFQSAALGGGPATGVAAAAAAAAGPGRAGGGSLFLERVFRLFDADNDGKLSFEEFVSGVRCFAPSASEAKVRFSFRLYAQRGAEKISPADLRELLAAVLAQSGIALSAAQVDDVVRLTFSKHDTDGDGFISYAEYAPMCAANPSVLRNLTINVREMLGE